MKLKDFFLSLAHHNIPTEIYYYEEHREDDFGFKINNIDSKLFSNSLDEYPLIFEIAECIQFAFSNREHSTLIDNMEGDTTYTLLSDSKCLKQASYFSIAYDAQEFWIEEHETEYYFENVEIPLSYIIITKDKDSFKIYDEKIIKSVVCEEEYNKFYAVYKKLLNEFQQMQIQLEVENFNEDKVYCHIINMSGSYIENVDFRLLDSDGADFSKEELKLMLINCFNVEPYIAGKVIEYQKI